jgi:phthalate 4,5-dioxygenase reductase subunit
MYPPTVAPFAGAGAAQALRIARKEAIATGIVLFRLEDPQGKPLPEFTPGAHVTVMTPTGLERKYSLANAPSDRSFYEIAVKREPNGRGGSRSLLEDTRVGDVLGVGEPRNHFALAPSQAGYLFIAGGIGITPIMSMIRGLEGDGSLRYRLVYCTRSPEHTAFREALEDLKLTGRMTLHHDGGRPERRLDLWPLLETPRGEQIYCCGPRNLMQEVRDMSGHWPVSAVHFESFGDGVGAKVSDRPFRVRLARTGRVVEVPVGTSILERLRAAGYEQRSSCESGSCGTCRTGLLAGEAEHRDFVLTEQERAGAIMICVSRARSAELVLDL